MANISMAAAIKQGECLSETSSRCVTASVTAAHNFEVTNFSLLNGMGIDKYVSSSTFSVGGRDWNIKLYPDGWKEEDKAAYVSIFLNLLSGAVGVKAKFSLSLRGKNDQEAELVKDTTHTFSCIGFWGWREFIEKSKLKPLLQLNNDCFTIRCVVTVIQDTHTEEKNTVVVPQSNLPQYFERMLKDGKGKDVTFSVGGQLLHAHRCVLSARSSVFEAELLGPMKKKRTQCIEIDEMEPSIFEALLYFIYTDSLPPDCEAKENATMQHLLVAVDRYGLDRLRLMCEAKLSHCIDVETVATTLTLAEQHHSVQLKDACLRFIASSAMLGDVMKTEGYTHLVDSWPLVRQEILDKITAVSKE